MKAGYGFLLAFGLSLALAEEYPPVSGTDRASVDYFNAAEQFLRELDLDDPQLDFERLGGTTATNWEVRRDGVPIANLKCSGGNTNHHGAIVTYRLGRALDFNIYPVAVYRDVDRRIGDRAINGQCALKEWSTVFTQYYWTRDTFADTDDRSKAALIQALRCENPRPSAGAAYRYYARSAYGNPTVPGESRVPYSGEADLLEAVRDFSTMMVVDALIGNEDRFPGGNAFFRSVSTAYEAEGDAILFESPRLFSLDNEAAFKGANPASTHAVRDLRDHVSRFDPGIIDALTELQSEPARLEQVTDGDPDLAAFVASGIGIVLDHYADAEARCGTAAVEL